MLFGASARWGVVSPMLAEAPSIDLSCQGMLNLTACEKPNETLTLPKISGHEVSNPSLVRLDEHRYFVVYKGVNYNLKESGYSNTVYAGFRVPFSDAQNYFAVVHWKSAPTIEAQGFLEDRHIRANPVALNGLQDIRLFRWKNRLYALAGAHCYLPAESGGRPKQTRMMLCSLDGNVLNTVAVLPFRQPKEKNWMPWPRDEELFLQYHCDPYEVLKFEGTRVSVAAGPRKIPGLEGFFGGSPILKVGSNYLGIAHRKVLDHPIVDSYPLPGMGYFHKAIVYGPDFEVLDVGCAFRFEGERVEFCCGMALDGETILFSYGIWDTEAKVMKMKARDFLELVELERWIPG